ncbi:acetyl-CoA C-acetyltransferase [Vagococcus elongatus]|uniref:acetyl-CoA C-acetyltransferase n=1 Tax=Vagococcus elongatus TaxID=180344 RepID=A0A430ALQ9_9ENTE|nr:acetyl-CoA C-acetyltransferase [Vagococcus elongatus]RSU09025.1 acetyl-CoA acetyltransferase [Vagococcus elongatus]
MRDVVIVSAVRTPIGNFGGIFKDVSAVSLGVAAGQGALDKINLSPNEIDEVIFGNVLGAGLGQNVARQISIALKIPFECPSFTVDMVCGSGLKAVMLGAQSIQTNQADVVLVGGTENMSQAPYLSENQRWGSKIGDISLVDSLLKDGLTDAFEGYHMGMTAENLAEKYHISREDQDAFALDSQKKTEKAMNEGKFDEEIIPVQIPKKRGEPFIASKDEYPRNNVTLASLSKLRPAFKKDGTVTAGNASGINDGAAAIILMAREKAEALGLEIMGQLTHAASAGVSPDEMGLGPIPATRKILSKSGLTIDQIDLVEGNEAFAVQSLCVLHELGLSPEKVNVNGGAIALGHPIGASGARILVTLVHEMKKRKVKKGLATLCIGGGQGNAVLIEKE